MSGRLDGRVAAITGSSRGIGLAVARAFLAEGAGVVVNSRDQAVAEKVAHELGAGAVGVGADVATEEGAEALIGAALEACGRLDVLVNNAGMPAAADTLDLKLDLWRRVVDLNMTAVFLCSREAARHMLSAGGGAIINTASMQAFAPFPRRLAYGSTKAAVVMMTRIMAAEWAPTIRVNAVAPGYVRTAMTERLREEGRLDFDAIARRTPQRRMAEPEEVAGAYIFLASSDASFVTGETIVVDGGWLAFGAYEGI
ncbi:MAG: SDR family oxidoreductase [Chloroflexi bacterium]|nr:MAG: SDR family oxidoreductase [Chloroflexota bacterium]